MEVKVNNISFSYGENKVFDDFSCFINNNLISAIIGASGSGKSTLLDLIDGLTCVDCGYIKIGNYKVSDKIHKKVGYLFQFSEEQIFNSTVYKEIEFGLKCFKYCFYRHIVSIFSYLMRSRTKASWLANNLTFIREHLIFICPYRGYRPCCYSYDSLMKAKKPRRSRTLETAACCAAVSSLLGLREATKAWPEGVGKRRVKSKVL